MPQVELFVFLLAAVALLAGAGLRHELPYPVVLVVGGLLIGLVPGIPVPELEPDVVFFVFLPPLLYSAAFLSSAYELRANARPISLLAVGLVLATIVVVAGAAHWMLGIPWAPAVVLGAVLGPTDPVSASSIIRRLGAPERIVTILEGESLVNDGSGLTAYKIAVGAVGAAAVSPLSAVGQFLAVAAGGIAIGLAIGWLVGRLRQMVQEQAIDVTLSLLTPFAAYVLAERATVSGVLAAVVAGLYVGHRSLELSGADARLRTVAFWEALGFLLNSLLFLLIGLQLPRILDRIEDASLVGLAGQALLIAAVAMAVRLLWMFIVPAVIAGIAPWTGVERPRANLRERLVLGWSGMRGAVSLAAALAIPLQAEGGGAFPERDRLIVLTYGVVLATLVIPGLTLAPLIRRLGVGQGEERVRQDAEARLRLIHSALERLEELGHGEHSHERAMGRVRDRYQARLERHESRLAEADGGDGAGGEAGSHEAAEIQRELLEAERATLEELRRERAYPVEVLQALERDLDVEESRLPS